MPNKKSAIILSIICGALLVGALLLAAQAAATTYFTQGGVDYGGTGMSLFEWTSTLGFHASGNSTFASVNTGIYWTDNINVPSGTVTIVYSCHGTLSRGGGLINFFGAYQMHSPHTWEIDVGNNTCDDTDHTITGTVSSWNGSYPSDSMHVWIGYWTDFYLTIHSVNFNGTTYYTDNPAVATPIPQGALPCITGTVATTPTVQPTMTPYGRATSTPAPTRTPGGPSPTPTATQAPVSGTVGFDSGLLTFDSNLAGLSAIGGVNASDTLFKFLRWSSVTGYDGHPGVVFMHTNVGFGGPSSPITHTRMMSEGGIVAYWKPGGGTFTGPVAVSLYARAAYTITTGDSHWVRVWYRDPNYDGLGNAAWYSQWDNYTLGYNSIGPNVGGLQVSNSWRKFGVVIAPTTGSGQIDAIGFDDYYAYADDTGIRNVGEPCPDYGCVYLDDVRIGYGGSAMFVLPICGGGTGTRTGQPQTSTRACFIPYTEKDMFSTCVAPTSIDLGAWVSYLWCNTVRFFGFYAENTEQVNQIQERQAVIEPIGSIAESGDVYDDLNGVVTSMQSANKTQAQSPIDWVSMMLDGSALDRPAQFSVPSLSSTSQYMANCPQEVIGISASTASGACMALYMMRQTIIVTFLQWGLNALFVIGVIALIRGDLEKLAS